MPSKSSAKRASPATQGLEVQPWMVFTLLSIFRVGNALSIKTFFQPDEYFQSLEPAWQVAFGESSGAWITWEWREQLRPAVHPWIFAVVYHVADMLNQAISASPSRRAEVLIAAPKLAQAVFAAAMDFYTWRLARTVYGRQTFAPLAALALTVLSPWQWHSSTRTFSNSIETTMTVAALELWPWEWFMQPEALNGPALNTRDDGASVELRDFLEGKSVDGRSQVQATESIVASPISTQLMSEQPRLLLSLAAAALACVLRPTNVIIWATIALITVFKYAEFGKTIVLAQVAAIIGPFVLAVTFYIDRLHYGITTFPLLQFFYFNLVQSLAVFYGRNRPDYYFTEGLPLLLTTALPFAAIGLHRALRPGPDRPQFAGYVERQTRYTLALAVVVTVLAFSLIAHKEMRFIYPLLPILHVLAAKPIAEFFAPFPRPKSYARLAALFLAVTVNVYIAAYVSTVHQRGVIDVLHFLRHDAESKGVDGTVRNTTIGFLMPCHSTPWRSHFIHPEINAWALTCEPPVDLSPSEREHYLDEADIFYADPPKWIEGNIGVRGRSRPWPDYIAFFEQLEPTMNAVLEGTAYTECWRGFNTHWHDDPRRRGDVVVRCLC